MSAKTKIVVLHMKEIIYTAIFLTLAVLMMILLVIMFKPDDKETAATSISTGEPDRYTAGVYNTPIQLNDNSFDVQVTVDQTHIKSIELINLSEATATMYPLMEPAMESLSAQICSTQSTDHIIFDEDNKYTSMLLLDAIKNALKKASPQ